MLKMITAAALCLGCYLLPYAMPAHAATVQEVTAQAEKGDADAQYTLGAMYYSGQGMPQDYAAACKWWEKAAEQGLDKAQFNVGCMYQDGLGVRQDAATAHKWYAKAAKQGNARAQFNLGVLHHKGLGVPQDFDQAKEWYGKACDNGNQNGCDEYKKLHAMKKEDGKNPEPPAEGGSNPSPASNEANDAPRE